MNREEAKRNGLKIYNGKSCKNCNTTEKFVSNWSCVSCTTESTKKRSPDVYKKYISSEKGKEWKKEYSKTKVYRDVQNRWVSKDYEKNKDKYHGYGLKKYGITPERYNELLTEQNKCCAICSQELTHKRLAVDHDHYTGEVRGLLCGPCNTSLGLLKENIETMNKMIEYILRFKNECV